jgi:hypothetical protein
MSQATEEFIETVDARRLHEYDCRTSCRTEAVTESESERAAAATARGRTESSMAYPAMLFGRAPRRRQRLITA